MFLKLNAVDKRAPIFSKETIPTMPPHEILVEDDVYFDKWDELIWYKDAPLAVPNEIWPWHVPANVGTDFGIGEGV